MLTYAEARRMMERARNGRRKLANNTYLVQGASKDSFAIRLHNTDVVTLHPDGSFTLNSGGWRTVTTKERINVYAPGRVASDRGAWYYYPAPGRDWSLRYPFADGMRVLPGGAVEGAGPDETAIRREIQKQVRKYIDGFCAHVAENGLADPNGGDCWGCYMQTTGGDGKPGADHFMGVGHIFEHFREEYYVPSLAWRAAQRHGNPAFCWGLMKARAERGDTDMLREDLRAYFRKLTPALVAHKLGEVGEQEAA